MEHETRTLTFRFFRDGGGRLRATLIEADVTKPVESAAHKRYRFRNIFPEVWKFLTDADRIRLQTATEGDVITVTLHL